MTPRGPRPLPVEVKRRRGTLRPGRVPNGARLQPVDPVGEVPPTPLAAFPLVLDAGAGWLAASDTVMLAMLRETMEEREQLRALVVEVGSRDLRRDLRAIDKQLVTMFAALGFDPSSRGRLGLAEVRARSTLDRLRGER